MGGVAVAAYAIVACLRAAEPQHTELFHIYYQPLIVCAAMLWMWGADVRLFERRRIAYAVCFSAADQQHLLSSYQIFQAWNAASSLGSFPTPCHAHHCAEHGAVRRCHSSTLHHPCGRRLHQQVGLAVLRTSTLSLLSR